MSFRAWYVISTDNEYILIRNVEIIKICTDELATASMMAGDTVFEVRAAGLTYKCVLSSQDRYNDSESTMQQVIDRWVYITSQLNGH